MSNPTPQKSKKTDELKIKVVLPGELSEEVTKIITMVSFYNIYLNQCTSELAYNFWTAEILKLLNKLKSEL